MPNGTNLIAASVKVAVHCKGRKPVFPFLRHSNMFHVNLRLGTVKNIDGKAAEPTLQPSLFLCNSARGRGTSYEQAKFMDPTPRSRELSGSRQRNLIFMTTN